MDLMMMFQNKRTEQQKNETLPTPDSRALATKRDSASLSSLRELSDSEREDFEERAAIMEFDGGLSKEADQLALEIILQRRRH